MGQWRIRVSTRTNSEGKYGGRTKGPDGMSWMELEGVTEQNVVGTTRLCPVAEHNCGSCVLLLSKR
jgi:hypothetical protein